MKNKISLKVLFALIATFVFAGVAFGSVKASAAAAEPASVSLSNKVQWFYDAEKDTLSISFKNNDDSANPESIGVFAIDKKPEDIGTKADKWKAIKVLTADQIKSTTGNSVTLKDLKLKTLTKYSSIALAEVENTTTAVKYTDKNYIEIQPAAAELKAVVIDFAKVATAGAASAEGCVLYSATYKVGDETSQTSEYATSSKALDGLKVLGGTEPFRNLEWTADDPKAESRVWQSIDSLNGEELYVLTHLTDSKGKATKGKIYIRVKGKSIGTADAMVASTGTKGYRPSKEKSVSISHEGKAPSVKLDVKTVNSIKLKNGYDFAVVASGESISASTKWWTILPYKNQGKATSAYVETKEFVAVAMPKAAADTGEFAAGETAQNYYTTSKISSVPIQTIFDKTESEWDDTDAVMIYFRKSAKSKTPASDYAYITLANPALKPDVEGLEEANCAIPTTGTSIKVTVGTGYSLEFAYVKAADAKASGYDKGVVNEVAAKAQNVIDFTTLKWKEVKNGKDAVTTKTKNSTYKVFSDNNGAYKDKETAATIAAGDYVLVRFKGSAGSTGRNAQAPKLASEIVVYKVNTVRTADRTNNITALIELELVTPANPK